MFLTGTYRNIPTATFDLGWLRVSGSGCYSAVCGSGAASEVPSCLLARLFA